MTFGVYTPSAIWSAMLQLPVGLLTRDVPNTPKPITSNESVVNPQEVTAISQSQDGGTEDPKLQPALPA